MRALTVQESTSRKLARQAGLAGVQFHAMGHCAHLGRISPGCYACFASVPCWGVRLGEDVGLPNVCNCDCVHCFREHTVSDAYAPPAGWSLPEATRDGMIRHFLRVKQAATPFAVYTFSGVAEPLFYLPVIRACLAYLRRVIEPEILGFGGWAKVYTNGLLLDDEVIGQLADMGVQELRINPTASGFAPRVFRQIEAAARVLPVVSVEVPAWPPYRERLLAMLPLLEAAGVRHLNVCQVEIMTPVALARVAAAFPEGELCQGHWMMLDDGGLVEEIMREVAARKYRYSVLDCNAFVKQIYAHDAFKRLAGAMQAVPPFAELCSTDVCRPGEGDATPVWRSVAAPGSGQAVPAP